MIKTDTYLHVWRVCDCSAKNWKMNHGLTHDIEIGPKGRRASVTVPLQHVLVALLIDCNNMTTNGLNANMFVHLFQHFDWISHVICASCCSSSSWPHQQHLWCRLADRRWFTHTEYPVTRAFTNVWNQLHNDHCLTTGLQMYHHFFFWIINLTYSSCHVPHTWVKHRMYVLVTIDRIQSLVSVRRYQQIPREVTGMNPPLGESFALKHESQVSFNLATTSHPTQLQV